ncbi:MAG: histidine phosphatase family protein [Ferruginibacter sp.]
MKKLFLVRHAKSSWENFSVADRDRPLNARGKQDAPEMAKRLLDKKIRIDAFVTSPAKRAKKTCKIFCKEFEHKEADILEVGKLYEASTETFFQVVSELDSNANCVAIFSHNPGITDFANMLCEHVKIDNMPTCGIFAVECHIKTWNEFGDSKKTFLFFDYPKSS